MLYNSVMVSRDSNLSSWGLQNDKNQEHHGIGQIVPVNPCPLKDCKCMLTAMIMSDPLNIETTFVNDFSTKFKFNKYRCVKCTSEWYNFTLPKCKKCGIVFKYSENTEITENTENKEKTEYIISTSVCGHVKKHTDCKNVDAMVFAHHKNEIIIIEKSPGKMQWLKKLFCCFH